MQRVVRDYSSSLCLAFALSAEPKQALERAMEMAKVLVDVLRFASFAILPTSIRPMIDINGPPQAETRDYWITISDSGRINPPTAMNSRHWTFWLEDHYIPIMQEIGVFELAAMAGITGRNITPFEADILRAVHWFADAQTQNDTENSFVSLAISLEVLCGPEADEPAGSTISDNVALLACDGVDSRIAMKQKVRDLYRLRSKISHGRGSGISDKDLVSLRDVVVSVIKSAMSLRDNWQDRAEFTRWLERKKFS
jgi:hypothetical protein